MPSIQTDKLGTVDYDEEQVVRFPGGIPPFADEHNFVLLAREEAGPVLFLQSLERRDLAFVTLPVQSIDPDYHLDAPPEQLEVIGLSGARPPVIGVDVLCLAIITLAEPPTANLLAPVVVNLANRLAVQAIQAGTGYAHQHPLEEKGKQERC